MKNIRLRPATRLRDTFLCAAGFPAPRRQISRNIAFAPVTTCSSSPVSERIQDSKARLTVWPATLPRDNKGSSAPPQPISSDGRRSNPCCLRVAQSRDAECSSGQKRGIRSHPPVVLMKSRSGEPFFISWRSQRDVVEELAVRSVLCIWGGPILALAGLWLLVSHFLRKSYRQASRDEHGRGRPRLHFTLPLDSRPARLI